MNRLPLLVMALLVFTHAAFAFEERHLDSSRPHTEESHEDHEEKPEASSNVGPGRAITAADPEKGIQLAPAALARIGARFVPVTSGVATVPKEAIVSRKEAMGVYRRRDGWLKFVPGSATAMGALVRFVPSSVGALSSGDQIAIEGVALLAVAELDAFSSGEGHGH